MVFCNIFSQIRTYNPGSVPASLIHIAVLKCLLLLLRNIRSIDVSDVVIRQMKEQNKGRPDLVFEKMDAMNMDYQVGYQTLVEVSMRYPTKLTLIYVSQIKNTRCL